jgi:hypothetical protein
LETRTAKLAKGCGGHERCAHGVDSSGPRNARKGTKDAKGLGAGWKLGPRSSRKGAKETIGFAQGQNRRLQERRSRLRATGSH